MDVIIRKKQKTASGELRNLYIKVSSINWTKNRKHFIADGYRRLSLSEIRKTYKHSRSEPDS